MVIWCTRQNIQPDTWSEKLPQKKWLRIGMFNGASTVSPSWGRSSANNGVITCYYYSWLVVSNIWFILHNGIILPIDELIFFKVVIAPPTRRYYYSYTVIPLACPPDFFHGHTHICWVVVHFLYCRLQIQKRWVHWGRHLTNGDNGTALWHMSYDIWSNMFITYIRIYIYI